MLTALLLIQKEHGERYERDHDRDRGFLRHYRFPWKTVVYVKKLEKYFVKDLPSEN